GRFNQKNVAYVDQLLEVPLKKGWISEEYYLGNKLFKAVTYEHDKGEKGAKIFTDFHSGCLGFVLFPLTLLLNTAFKLGIAGERKLVIVGPIEEQLTPNRRTSQTAASLGTMKKNQQVALDVARNFLAGKISFEQ